MTGPEIQAWLGGTFTGDAVKVERLNTAAEPSDGGCVVASNAAALDALLASGRASQLALLVVTEDADVGDYSGPLLRHPQPRLVLARLTRTMDAEPQPADGIHPTAFVHDDALIGDGCAIGPNVTVDAGAVLADGVTLDAGVVIGAHARLGEGTRIFPNAVIYPRTQIGRHVRIHSGTVIGSDGFGYEAGPQGAEKIHHLGWVEIEDHVEIGAQCAVDRGTLGATRIGAGSKIDNLVQVGHNVHIGRHCIVAGMAGIAGSTTLEDGVTVGAGAGVTDHATVGAGATLAGRAGVTKDVPAGET
jgi:UDP-3-O-[3-hydroxymyristoyl] glucosamine N-acyltransferase